MIPLANVGGGTLIGAVAILLGLMQHDAVFEFDAVSAAVGVLVVGLSGYLPPRYKSFVMASAAVIASLVAALLGWIFFDSPFDPNIVSFQAATLIVAFAGYVLPTRGPDATIAQELDAAVSASLAHRSRARP